MSDPLLNIINGSLETGTVADIIWKIATIIPIAKISNTEKAEEFRPVNMLDAHW